MHYLYLIHSKSANKFYVGTTPDLPKRFYSHNQGKNPATKSGIPWKLVYYEAYPTKVDAINREQKLKQYGQALIQLKKRITLVE